MATPQTTSLHVELTHEGRVLHLTFDHGKANEMGSEQLRELEAVCDVVEGDERVQVMVTRSTKKTSRGTPIFVAGANVTERLGWDDDRVLAHVDWQRSVLQRVRRLPVLHVGLVQGVALGWGLEYLLCCDLVVGQGPVRLGVPETGLGIVPGAGGTALLAARVGTSQALRLGMTGQQVGHEEALRIGLLDAYVASEDELAIHVEGLVSGALSRSPLANAAFKAAVLDEADARLQAERTAYERCVRSGNAAFGRNNFRAIREGAPLQWPSRLAGED